MVQFLAGAKFNKPKPQNANTKGHQRTPKDYKDPKSVPENNTMTPKGHAKDAQSLSKDTSRHKKTPRYTKGQQKDGKRTPVICLYHERAFFAYHKRTNDLGLPATLANDNSCYSY